MLDVRVLPHHYRMMLERGICTEFLDSSDGSYFIELKKRNRLRVYVPEISGAFIIRPDGDENNYKTADCFFEFPYPPRESAEEMEIKWIYDDCLFLNSRHLGLLPETYEQECACKYYSAACQL